MGSEHSTEWLKRSQYLDVLSSHVLPPATLSWPLFLQCKFFCTGYAAFCSWLCPLAPSKDMYGGHAPFQPYMEAKHVHQYLCRACYEGFWQVPWLSSLTLTRSKAQFGKSRKKGREKQTENREYSKNWDTSLLLHLLPFLLGTSRKLPKEVISIH